MILIDGFLRFIRKVVLQAVEAADGHQAVVVAAGHQAAVAAAAGHQAVVAGIKFDLIRQQSMLEFQKRKPTNTFGEEKKN